MRKIQIKFLIFAFYLAIFIPCFVFAAEFYFEPDYVTTGFGDTFALTLYLSSPEGINAFEGKLKFSHDILLLEEVRIGNSIIPLWIERPSTDFSEFAGVVPGGFYSKGGEIATFIFRGISAGSDKVSISNLSAFLNDGLATQAKISLPMTQVDIASEPTGSRADVLEDTEPPIEFIVEIVKSEVLFGGKWFITFLSQDKKSGIRRYEVAEKKGFLKPRIENNEWVQSESPYLLKDQDLTSWIFVKAIDGASNERITVLEPSVRVFYQQAPIITVGILVFLMVALLVRMILRKKYRL